MLFKVVLPNDYFPVGAFVESQDDDMVQQVRVSTKGNRLQVGGYYGIIIPLPLVRQYTMAIMSRGMDDRGAHAELRGAYKPIGRKAKDDWEEYLND
jgi:hypothetical protein